MRLPMPSTLLVLSRIARHNQFAYLPTSLRAISNGRNRPLTKQEIQAKLNDCRAKLEARQREVDEMNNAIRGIDEELQQCKAEDNALALLNSSPCAPTKTVAEIMRNKNRR